MVYSHSNLHNELGTEIDPIFTAIYIMYTRYRNRSLLTACSAFLHCTCKFVSPNSWDLFCFFQRKCSICTVPGCWPLFVPGGCEFISEFLLFLESVHPHGHDSGFWQLVDAAPRIVEVHHVLVGHVRKPWECLGHFLLVTEVSVEWPKQSVSRIVVWLPLLREVAKVTRGW